MSDLHSMPDMPADSVLRPPPHAIGAEKSVLSIVMQDPQRFLSDAIAAGVTAAKFYLPAHRTIWDEICRCVDATGEADLTTMVQRLLDRNQLGNVGGPSALYDIWGYAPSPAMFKHHVGMLEGKAMLREVILIANEAIEEAYQSPDVVGDLVDATEAKLSALRLGTGIRPEDSTSDAVSQVIAQFEAMVNGEPGARGIQTGFEQFDRMTGGLKPGQMVVVAARPSMGKTALMMNMVERPCFDAGIPTLVFSLEMTRFQLVQRLTFSRAKYSTEDLKNGTRPDKGDLMRIQRATLEVAKAPLYIDDTPGLTITAMRAKAEKAMAAENVA